MTLKPDGSPEVTKSLLNNTDTYMPLQSRRLGLVCSGSSHSMWAKGRVSFCFSVSLCQDFYFSLSLQCSLSFGWFWGKGRARRWLVCLSLVRWQMSRETFGLSHFTKASTLQRWKYIIVEVKLVYRRNESGSNFDNSFQSLLYFFTLLLSIFCCFSQSYNFLN